MSDDRIAWDGGTVGAAWDGPDDARVTIVLAHGAGGTMHSPQLRAVATALGSRGLRVLRFNFPYVEAKRKAPDRAPTLEACYRAVAAVASASGGHVVLGGRSMGGRMASHIVAAGTAAAGLVFLAYPLHPPGKPERLRDAHLPAIEVPMLFVQGTRDPFARPDLLDATLASLPSATLHRIENGDHSHKVPGRGAADVTNEIVGAIVSWLDARVA